MSKNVLNRARIRKRKIDCGEGGRSTEKPRAYVTFGTAPVGRRDTPALTIVDFDGNGPRPRRSATFKTLIDPIDFECNRAGVITPAMARRVADAIIDGCSVGKVDDLAWRLETNRQ